MNKKLLGVITFVISGFLNAQDVNLEWVKQLDVSYAGASDNILSVDGDASVYTTGSFEGTTDFDPGTGTYELTAVSDPDYYVMKQDVAGNLVWAHQWDVIGIQAMTTDKDGNTYFSGTFFGTRDFDPGTGVGHLTSSFGDEIFIVKLDASGDFVWVKHLESSTGHFPIQVSAIHVDASAVYVTGSFDGTIDFDPGVGSADLTAVSDDDGFLVKLDTDGNYVWAQQLVGDDDLNPYGITTDASGNVYTAGSYSGTVDFNPGAGDSSITATNNDAYLLKLDASGNFEWARSYGKVLAINRSVQLDAVGDVYVTGYFQDTVDFDFGAGTTELVSEGDDDVFLSKISSQGDFVWAKQLGGTSSNLAYGLAIDTADGVYITGSLSGTMDANPGVGDSNLVSMGNTDAFVIKLDTAGDFQYAKQYGGTDNDVSYAIVVNDAKNVFTAGHFAGTVDFDPSTATSNLTASGSTATFVHKMSTCPATYATIDTAACSSYDVPSGDETYTVTGTYLDTIPNTAGCDSILTINVTFNNTDSAFSVLYCGLPPYITPSGKPQYSSLLNLMDTIPNSVGCDSILTINLTMSGDSSITVDTTVCDTFVSPSGKIFTTSNTYMDTIPTVAGCDSVFTINLTVNTATDSTFDVTVCETYTVPSGDETYTVSGTYTDTIPTVAGCDSLLTINLTVNYHTDTILDVLYCGAAPYILPSGAPQFSSLSGIIDIIPNSVGCDSVLTINLTMSGDSSITVDTTVCDTFVSPSGKIFTTSNTYMDTIPTVAGCDSLFTINLTVKNSTTHTIDTVVCNTYTSPSGKVYNVSNTYLDTIPNAVSCDSIITINLTVNSSSASFTEVVLCDAASYTVPSGDETYSVNGIVIDTIPNVDGCDSIMTIDITFNSSTTNTLNITNCDSYTVPSGDETYTAGGTYMDTIPNAIGCDSVLTINLTISSSTTSFIQATVCSTYVAPSGAVLTTSGTHIDVISNAAGCDSVITIDLTINNTTATIDTAACNTYTSPSGKVFTTSNTYMDTIPNAVACDSIITINLTINTETSSSVNISACDSYTVPSGDETYTMDGTYMDTIPNVAGCDSIMTLNVVFSSSTTSSINAAACDSYTSPSGKVFTSSNTYLDTIANSVGCDSVITINLTINSTVAVTIDTTACNTFVVPNNGATYSSSSVIVDTVTSSIGCDSIITYDLTIVDINTTIELSNDSVLSLIDTLPGATYQWIDCQQGDPIVGATSSTYIASARGNYTVNVTVEGCSELLDCIQVSNIPIVGVDEYEQEAWTLYPNPASGQFTITGDQLQGRTFQIQLINVLGEVVMDQLFYAKENSYTVSLEDITPGVYTFKLLDSEFKQYQQKVVID